MKINEAVIITERYTDPRGIGNIPKNQDIDYFGIKVKMSPAVFLSLAADVGAGVKEDSINYIIDRVREGEKVAPPYLSIELPHDWTQRGPDNNLSLPVVTGHEGRHRMMALAALYGRNIQVEVHITFSYLRRRDIQKEWIDQLNEGIISEKGNRVVYNAIMNVMR